MARETAPQTPDNGRPGPEDPVAELQAKVAKLEDSLLRAKADFQNLQRRSAAERLDALRYANAELMKSLVKVVDDFERSLAAASKPDNLPAVVEGVRLVYENLTKALSDHGLETIEALHRPFDPNVHEALLHQPSDRHSPGTVIQQIAKGYRLCDRVVRPAKVIVAKAMEPVVAGAATEPEGKADSTN
ncbi:MAG: nucleotide exchange factor GrpE [Planctomycetota bacterium]